jgi:DNA polymerase V
MGDQNKKSSYASGMSPLHQILGMTPDQVHQDLLAQGFDPDAEVEAIRRMARVMAAKFAGQIRREEGTPSFFSKSFPMFEEAVAAGAPAWATSSPNSNKASLAELLGGSNPSTTVWVPVSGWSMRGDGINDGDTVLVDTSAEPNDGDIIVAHIAGEGQVVKRIRIGQKGKIVLESSNPDFAPRAIEDNAALRIHGVVVGRAGKI